MSKKLTKTVTPASGKVHYPIVAGATILSLAFVVSVTAAVARCGRPEAALAAAPVAAELPVQPASAPAPVAEPKPAASAKNPYVWDWVCSDSGSSQGVSVKTEPVAPAAPVACEACEEKSSCNRFGTTIDFVSSPTVAFRDAVKAKKLVLVLHISGNFEEAKFT